MGTINQGILGGFSGKVGPIVGFRWKSKYYIRARAAKVSNPRTPKQQEQRGKFATAFNFLKNIKPFVRIGYKEFTRERSAFNSAMSYMLKRAVTGDGKDVKIDFDRVLVSTGSLMPVFEGTATQDRDKMYFDWQDNSSMGNAESADIAMLLVYNKDKETAVYDTEAALRSDRHAELSLPNDWEGDELVAYLSFCSADGNSIANSISLPISTTETALHTPDSNDSSIELLTTMPDLIIPAYSFVPVEKDKMAFVNHTAALIHVTNGLFQSLCNGRFKISTLYFQFQNDALKRPSIAISQWFRYQQVRTSTA